MLHFLDAQMMSCRTIEEISSGLIMVMSNCIHICSRMQLLMVIHCLAVQCPFLSYSIIQQMAMKISHWKEYLHQKDKNWRKAWKNGNLKQRRLKRNPEKVCQQNVRIACCFAALSKFVLFYFGLVFFVLLMFFHSSNTEVIELLKLLCFSCLILFLFFQF